MATSSHDKRVFIGIDVQLSRGLAFAVMIDTGMDGVGRVVGNGWLKTFTHIAIPLAKPGIAAATLLSSRMASISVL